MKSGQKVKSIWTQWLVGKESSVSVRIRIFSVSIESWYFQMALFSKVCRQRKTHWLAKVSFTSQLALSIRVRYIVDNHTDKGKWFGHLKVKLSQSWTLETRSLSWATRRTLSVPIISRSSIREIGCTVKWKASENIHCPKENSTMDILWTIYL